MGPAASSVTRSPAAAVLPALFAGLFATLLSGCGFIGERPAFSIESARLVERTDTALRLEFELVGTNRLDEPLPLRSIEYQLSVDGTSVFQGIRAAESTLPASGTQTILLPAVVDLDAIEPGALSPRYALSGRIEYSKPGALADTLFDANLVKPKVGFSDRGTLDLTGELSRFDAAPNPSATAQPGPAPDADRAADRAPEADAQPDPVENATPTSPATQPGSMTPIGG